MLRFFGIFPEKLIQNLQMAMGATQAITATIAMLISYTIYIVNKKSLETK